MKIAAAFKKIYNLAVKAKKPKQGTFCYCPKCKNELISSGSFVSDEKLVTYKCTDCGTVTEWLFDAPAPILWIIDGEETE